MTSTHASRAAATAAYLRCYPYDTWQMAVHVRALEQHAGNLGLGAPYVFLDNGISCRTVQPQLRLLLARAAMGFIDTVLVPGRWVFSIEDRTADAVTEFLRAAGARVFELPHRMDAWQSHSREQHTADRGAPDEPACLARP
ncbi:hypothetical protein QMK19_31875 [Streptomyces sp. H10-C2]|uniref:hypothetical protein n=1 Tax=unclassified Streptomyces TaxID=2593676 RepID=UPI0024BA961D|nr:MULTISPECIES: hypothetical protein [unclassified Streptomyces]MDJ0345142.1 hypothetical protein [Streptomyces sp. PH10-H1]MDJ0374110.1 hypothetical protein [Streptomyces sp. H10-C2]